ncbi:ImmA/IrrE family metallo-endopeptidase [Paludibaculum fermentans]|uniref:ImmA/IrrE family metallo-endopeptidase n=1 Tax=Paludibaculum fermentans TaxID=1473598 RepID=UPI003EBC1D42
MKVFRSRRGPFQEQPYYEDAEIEAICLDELRQFGLLPSQPEPIRVERFVEKRFDVTVESADLPEGILGFTEFTASGVSRIFVSARLEEEGSKTSERRVRSTIAHEAGHGLLHAHLFAIQNTAPLFADNTDPKAPKVLCREGGADPARRNYGGEWWEFQANAAMGHLLVPKPLLPIAVGDYLVPAGNLGGKCINPTRYEAAVRAVAEAFDVNAIVARIRLETAYPAKNDKQLML